MQTDSVTPLLYHSGTSVCSQKVRLVLAHLAMPYDETLLNLQAGDQFAPSYIALNPNAVVPTLVWGSEVITESNLIMMRLAHEAGPQLYSRQNDNVRHSIDHWLERSTELHKAINAMTYLAANRERFLAMSETEFEERLAQVPEEWRRARLRAIVVEGAKSQPVIEARGLIDRALADMKETIGKKDWMLASEPTLADFAIFPMIYRLELLGFDPLWRIDNTALNIWLANVKQSKAFAVGIETYIGPAAIKKFQDAGRKVVPDLLAE